MRVVIRYAALHPTSEEGIRILEAARKQLKFEPVLERLIETQSTWAPHGQQPAPTAGTPPARRSASLAPWSTSVRAGPETRQRP